MGEFQVWFGTDAVCLGYLEWLGWPDGFVCPGCAHAGGWRLGDGRFECAACACRSSPTAGTIFDRSRTPLTVWFTACWLFASEKDGISALSVKRQLEIGSYQTAWAMLHRLRSVLVRPGRERLRGEVEVDETYFGGEGAGACRRARQGQEGAGRRRRGADRADGLRPLPHGSARRRLRELPARVPNRHGEPGARVVTDGWQSYRPAIEGLYTHEPSPGASGPDAAPEKHERMKNRCTVVGAPARQTSA